MSKAREREDYVSGAGEIGIISEKTYRHDELFEMENGSLEKFELRYEGNASLLSTIPTNFCAISSFLSFN